MMNTHLIMLQLMVAQGLLGAFDTLYHHELTEALPQRATARLELSIHSARALIYSVLFIGLSAWEWHGVWAAVLLIVFAVEIVLTLWDFVIEDRTRLLPASERVTHTILAINGGAFITLLVLNVPAWWVQTSSLYWHPHGWLSVFLALCGIGVGLSGIRDGLAAKRLSRLAHQASTTAPLSFSDTPTQVLVTGATGFIGQLLVRALLRDGQHVTILSRRPKQAAWLFDGKVRVVSDMRDVAENHVIDIIINLAGARILGWRWSEKRKATLLRSRIATTDSLVAWMKTAKQKPRLFLSASAIGYYGIQAPGDERPLTETNAPQSIFMSELCQQWEASAQAAKTSGVSVICMRFGLVLGQQGALPMMLLPIRLGLGGALGSGKQWLSWIHVDDVLGALAHVWQRHLEDTPRDAKIDKSRVTAYNFTAPQALTQKEFSHTAAQLLHRPCIVKTPALPLKILLGEQSSLLLEGQRVTPAALLAAGYQFKYSELRSALTSLL